MRHRKYGLLVVVVVVLLCVVLAQSVSAAAHGDFTNDGRIGSQDALYLLRHVLNPNGYTVDQSADVNGDGKVNSKDALHLLRHSLNPASYPLIEDHDAQLIPGKAATCTEDGLTEGSACTVCDAVIQEQTVIPALGHSYKNGVCSACGAGNAAMGLQLELLPDGSGYVLVGIGQCADTEIVVPDTYNGLPVTTIASRAFSGSSVTSVTLGKNVQRIESCAFYDCKDLKKIVILAENITFDGNSIVYGCDSLEQFWFTQDPVFWEQERFYLADTVQVVLNYGHTYSAVIVTPADCTHNGVTKYTCRDCGKVYQQQTLALGHYYAAEDRVDPTCTEDGSADGTCTRCGHHIAEVLPALGHRVESYTQQEMPTCEYEGSEVGFCTNCEQYIERAVPALTHTPGAFTGSDEYCGEHQLGSAVCTTCGEEVYKIDHVLQVTSQLSTCTQSGYLITACVNCDYSETVAYPVAEHTAGAWQITQDATCTEEGARVKYCTGCDAVVETETIAKREHIISALVADGVCTYTCCDCDYVEAISITDKKVVTLVSGCEPELPVIYVEEGQVPQLPVPVWEGYTFLGWCVDEGGTIAYEDTPVTEDVTLYALWGQNQITASSDEPQGIVDEVDVNYRFAVKSAVALTNDNLDSYITVTSSGKDIVDIFVAGSEGDIYYIGGNYRAGDIYKAVATGEVTFVESGAEPLWFVISGPERDEVVAKDETVILTRDQICGEYSDGIYDYIFTNQDLLNVGQMVMVIGEDQSSLCAVYEIVDETAQGQLYQYKCMIPDPGDVLEQVSIFTREEVSFENAVLAENWEETVVQSVSQTQTYAAFCEAATVYARTLNNSNSKYTYTLTDFDIKPSVKFELPDGQLVITVEISCNLERKSNSSGKVIDVSQVSLKIEQRMRMSVSVSADNILEGDARVVVTTIDTLTVDFALKLGFMDNDRVQEEYFRNLYKNALGKKDLLPIDTKPGGKETLIPAGYVPIPLPGGFALDVTIYVVLDWEVCGQFGAGVTRTKTTSYGLEMDDWDLDTVAYKSYDIAMNAYLSGKVRVSAGIRAEVGISWIKLVRIGVNETVSVYVEIGGMVGFVKSADRPLEWLKGGYVSCGINLQAKIFGELGVSPINITVDKVLFDKDYPIFEFGDKEMVLYFEADGEEYTVYTDYDTYVDLRDLVDVTARVQSMETMEIESKEQKKATYSLVEWDKNVELQTDGALMIKGCDQTEFALKIRVESGLIHKEITVHVYIDHTHVYETTHYDGTCTQDEYNLHECTECIHKYKEVLTPAPGHDYSQFIIDKYPTCEEDGLRHGACARCGYMAAETMQKLGHDYSLQIPEAEHLYRAATCQNVASYYYVCANCGGHRFGYTYKYGELGDHSYSDPYTCHDRECTTAGCTYVSYATTEHPMTPWIEVEPGGCSTVGYSLRACRDCGYAETDLDTDVIREHDWQVQPDLEPTCQSAGYQDYILCASCGMEANKTTLDPLEHNILYKDINETTHVEYCHRRGCDYESDPIIHDYEDCNVVVQPSCETIGIAQGICACGHIRSEDIPKLGHKPVPHDAKAPTCTEIGWDAYETCERCDYSTYEERQALGHAYDESLYEKTAEGHRHLCTREGCAQPQQSSYTAHTYGAWETVTEGNCTTDAVYKRVCAICLYEERDVDKAPGHQCPEGVWQTDENGHWQICQVCGEKDNYMTHGYGQWVTEKEASCTEAGEKTKQCATCTYKHTQAIPALDHDSENGQEQWDEDYHWTVCGRNGCDEILNKDKHNGNWHTVQEPTCVTKERQKKSCDGCEYEQTRELDYGDHDRTGEWECNDTQHYRICSYCDQQIDQDDHVQVQNGATVSPTCTKEGYTPYQCSTCGHRWHDDKVPATGHDYEQCEAQEPTCTQDGWHAYQKCTVCGDNNKETIPATGHEEVIDHGVAPDCTNTGLTHGKHCSVCGEILVVQETIPANGHTEAPAVTENETAANCVNGGAYDSVVYCADCGEELSRDTITGDPLGHDAEGGQTQYDGEYHWTVCGRNGCDEILNKTEHENNWKTVQESTCAKKGQEESICSCGYEQTRELDYADHNHTGGWERSDAQHYRICPDCQQQIDQDEHTPVQNGATVSPTCTEEGYTPYKCAICEYQWKGDKVLPTDHDYEQHDAKEPTCTDEGWGEYLTCKKCDYSTQVKTKLPHNFGSQWESSHDVYHYHTCTVCGTPEPSEDWIKHSLKYETTEAATCTSPGNRRTYCVICDYEKNDPIDSDPDHDHSGKLQYDEQNSAQHYRICSKCDEKIDYADHSYTSRPISPDCENQGYDQHTCDCGHSYEDEFVDALGHADMDAWHVDEQAGEHYHSCSRYGCAHETDRGAHIYSLWEMTVPATCTTYGTQQRICSVCEAIETDDKVPMLPHELYEGVKTETKTITGGVEYHHYVAELCRNCDYEKQLGEVIVSNHQLVAQLNKEWPTCTEPGRETGWNCAVPGCEDETHDKPQEIIPALGHDYVDGYCTRCGEQEQGLEYTLSDDGTYYIVTGIGTWTGTELEIPSVYSGLPVKEIGSYAFEGIDGVPSVTIPGSVVRIGEYAFAANLEMLSITIQEGVTSIGRGAFEHCEGLSSVVIPGSVTNIEDFAFISCRGMESLTILDGVKTIGESAFNNCASLTSVTIPASVTAIGDNAFLNCASMTGIWVDAENEAYSSDASGVLFNKAKTQLIRFPAAFSGEYEIPAGVTSVYGSAFRFCPAITAITIPNSVTELGEYAFFGCTGISSISIPDSVTNIGRDVLGGCTGLTSVQLPDGMTSIADSMFSECTGLTEVAIPHSVTSIGNGAFRGCTALKQITLPDGVTSIGRFAFNSCASLTEITIPSGMTSIGNGAFWWCTGLKTLYFEGTTEQWDAVTKGTDWNQNCTFEVICLGNQTASEGLEYTLSDDGTYYIVTGIGTWTGTELEIPSVYSGLPVKEIGSYAFEGSDGVPSVTIPGSVVRIGEYAFAANLEMLSLTIQEGVISIGRGAFEHCEGLSSVVIPGSVTNIEDFAFISCRGMESLTILDGVKTIGESAFNNCASLTSVTIPASVTAIGDNAFLNCASLTGIWVDAENEAYSSDASGVLFNKAKTQLIRFPAAFSGEYEIPAGVTSVYGSAFRFCSAVTAITIPDGVTDLGEFAFFGCTGISSISIPDSVTNIGSDVLRGCTGLTSVQLPDGMTHIADSMFWDCTGLTEIAIPHSVTSIGNWAFWGCTALKQITLPDGVTSIGHYAFNSCASLTEITIPSGVTSIGIGAFWWCTGLKTLYFEGTTEQWDAVTKGTDWNQNCTFEVVCAS